MARPGVGRPDPGALGPVLAAVRGGPSESVVAAVVQTALQLAPTLTDGPSAAWLSGHDLAPCHWFSFVKAEPVVAPAGGDVQGSGW